jgi:hypothetical protein
MPFIRSLKFKYCALLVISIFLNGEIINPYSRYMKKGLICITIMASSSRQPFFILSVLKRILIYYIICA